MPSFTPTGQTTGGLLSKLQDPDSRGLTFGDRLFAAGQALGGDSGGAATYLQNQRKMAQEEDDRMTAKRNAIAGAQALRDNYGPEGFNARGYMQAMGENLDPATLLALKKGVGRNFTSNGGVAAFDPDAGTARQVIAGTPKAPGPLILKPGTDANNPQNWVPNPNYMAATQEKSAAERAGKPLAPRVGRAPPKPGVPRPVATGRVF
jgi:hypothetical protein